MKVDNANAFRFILQDEIYLLQKDKTSVVAPAAHPATEADTGITSSNVPEQDTPPISPPALQPAQSVIKTPETKFNYLGRNNKNFAILLNYAADEFIPTAHLTALESMLKRKGYELDDVAIVNLNRYASVTLKEIAEAFKPVKLLIMGKDSLPQGIGNLPHNQAVQGKKTNVLYSYSFDEMMSSNENKKAFWEQMKNL